MNKERFEIVEDPIPVDEVIQKVVHPNAGAVNVFIGTVREMTNGKRTIYLKYEAYIPMAIKQFRVIEAEILKRWPEVRLAITHRIGELHITDTAVVIACSSPHRAASFEACRYAIERIKEIVPIWKKEHWDNGECWVGDQKEQHAYPNGEPEKEGL